MTLRIPRHPRFDEWSENAYGQDTFPCAVCGKSIKDAKVKYRVYVDNGGLDLLSREEARLQ